MGKYLGDMSRREINLPYELNNFISAGFIEKSGAVFFKSLFKDQVSINLRNNLFFDVSGFEYTTNKFHIEDYSPQDKVFFSAFQFLSAFENLWLMNFTNKKCFAVINFQVDGTHGNIGVFTFYIDRPGEVVIDLEKINEFKEPIFIKMIK